METMSVEQNIKDKNPGFTKLPFIFLLPFEIFLLFSVIYDIAMYSKYSNNPSKFTGTNYNFYAFKSSILLIIIIVYTIFGVLLASIHYGIISNSDMIKQLMDTAIISNTSTLAMAAMYERTAKALRANVGKKV